VLISHNMPEVFEVADRIEVLRLGERVARLKPSEVSMEDVVSAMTGALTFHEEDSGDRDRDRARGRGAPADLVAAPGRGSATQIGLILVGLIVIFSILEPENFTSVNNARNIATDAAVLLVIATGMTYVIITAGIDLSVGSVLVFSGVIAAKLMNQVGGDNWGVIFVGSRQRSPPGSPGG
jgi:ABC-type glutathione transport system ATPase component